MRLARRPLAALATVLAALTGAGCGGDTDASNAYVDEVQAAQRSYAMRFDQVSKRLTATSTLAQDRSTLTAFGKATGTFVTALREVEPPAQVEDEHGALVGAVAGYQRQVQQAGARLAEGDAATRARVRTELSSSVAATQTRIADAIGDINRGLRD